MFTLGEGGVEMRGEAAVVKLEATLAQPAADGHAKAFLSPRNDLGREQRLERFL